MGRLLPLALANELRAALRLDSGTSFFGYASSANSSSAAVEVPGPEDSPAGSPPLPGIDWLTDVAVLAKLIPDINRAFGLTPAQVERLAPDRRLVVYKAISAGGSMLIGKLVTRELVL